MFSELVKLPFFLVVKQPPDNANTVVFSKSFSLSKGFREASTAQQWQSNGIKKRCEQMHSGNNSHLVVVTALL